MDRSSIITGIVLLSIVAGVAFIAFTRSIDDAPQNTQLSFSNEVDSVFTDLAGEPVDLSQFDNTVRVVNSWASWCPFCVNELPDFDELASGYDREDVVVIAINRKEPTKTVQSYLETIESLPHVTLLLDPTDSFYSSIGGFAMPETIFYNRDGEVVVHKRGFMKLEEMRRHTEAALAQ